MSRTSSTLTDPPALTEALNWLHENADGEPFSDLVPLRKHLRGIRSLSLAPLVLLRILDLFEPRVTRVHKAISPLLIDTRVPLPRTLRVISQGLGDVHEEMARGFLDVLDHSGDEGFQRPKRRREVLLARGLTSLCNWYELTLNAGSRPTPALWESFAAVAAEDLAGMVTTAASPSRLSLQYMMGLSAAQPDALTVREQLFLFDYAKKHASLVELATSLPADPKAWLWMAPGEGHPPSPLVRRNVPGNTRLIFHSCRKLGEMTQLLLNALADGISPAELGLDEKARLADYRNVLHHACRRWIKPPPRRHLRNRGNYRVQVCPSLDRLWAIQKGEPDGHSDVAAEWMILNDSPAGYAAMHVAGKMPALLAGSVIGIRRLARDPWSLCLIRWIHSDNSEHLEVGLEMLAARAEAVRVASPSKPNEPQPAFLLPPVQALQRSESLLTTRGSYDTGRIALLQETEGRLQVVECQPRPLALQTSSVELFEFDRLQLPGI